MVVDIVVVLVGASVVNSAAQMQWTQPSASGTSIWCSLASLL